MHFRHGNSCFLQWGRTPAEVRPALTQRGRHLCTFSSCAHFLLLKTCKLGEISAGIISLCVDSPVILVSSGEFKDSGKRMSSLLYH